MMPYPPSAILFQVSSFLNNESSCSGSSDKENAIAELTELDGEGAENLELSDADADTDDNCNIAVTKQKKRTSWVWNYFKSQVSEKKHACLLCSNDGKYNDFKAGSACTVYACYLCAIEKVFFCHRLDNCQGLCKLDPTNSKNESISPNRSPRGDFGLVDWTEMCLGISPELY
jgi:hypothetical protein